MSARTPRELVVVGAAITGLLLIGGVGSDAFGAPADEGATTTTTDTSSTTTTAAPTTTTATTAPQSAADVAIHRWFPENEQRARDIAWCESRLDPHARSRGGGNHGLFQINNVHRGDFARVTGVSWANGRYDADANAHFARHLYDEQGWEPWACA
jgi:hypothetical protein